MAGDAAAAGLAADRTDLAAAANVNGTTPAALLTELRTDDTAWLDECGRQFYVDSKTVAGTAQGPAAVASTGTAAALYPYTRTFTLHSRPGSRRVIYLDFTGHTVVDTAWNDLGGAARIVAPAFDLDGRRGFSGAEQGVIQRVWAAVAEDYAPFDVDVTTQQPPAAAITRDHSGDSAFGTRVLITPTDGWLRCGCGGVAYRGVFDLPHSGWHGYYQPAFVFSRASGNTVKGIAEAVSHEAGHNLGLKHDGTTRAAYYAGHAAWAPIMGVGYYRPITQWSRGQYGGADNRENDLSVIAAGGAPLARDDHPNSRAAARPVVAGVGRGVISTATDIDYFSFRLTRRRSVVVTATPATVNPNLDIVLTVIDRRGRKVASANPRSGSTRPSYGTATGLSARVAVRSLPAGVYTVRVDGVGAGNAASTGYSDFGSLGRYRLTVR